jgi:hypothetical protein
MCKTLSAILCASRIIGTYLHNSHPIHRDKQIEA